MTRFAPLALIALTAAPAFAEAEKYVLDPSHSQIVFTYNHLGYSTSTGMFSGFDGEIQFDQANPAASSVTVAFPVKTMLTAGRRGSIISCRPISLTRPRMKWSPSLRPASK